MFSVHVDGTTEKSRFENNLYGWLLGRMARIVGSDLTSGASLQVVRLSCYGCGKIVSRDEVCRVRGSALGYAFLFLDRARCLVSASGAPRTTLRSITSQQQQQQQTDSIEYNVPPICSIV